MCWPFLPDGATSPWHARPSPSFRGSSRRVSACTTDGNSCLSQSFRFGLSFSGLRSPSFGRCPLSEHSWFRRWASLSGCLCLEAICTYPICQHGCSLTFLQLFQRDPRGAYWDLRRGSWGACPSVCRSISHVRNLYTRWEGRSGTRFPSGSRTPSADTRCGPEQLWPSSRVLIRRLTSPASLSYQGPWFCPWRLFPPLGAASQGPPTYWWATHDTPDPFCNLEPF